MSIYKNEETRSLKGTINWLVNQVRTLLAATPGTVTSVSVTTANGISGTVATATTTPDITLDISALDSTKIADGSVTNTEFQYLNGVTSNLQTQINSKIGTGVIGSSGLTMSTARLLGRTTASSGAIEEITVGSGLSLSAGTLSSINPTVYETTVTVTSAELLNLFTTEKTLISAPSAGTYISVLSLDMLYDYGGTAYANTGNILQIRYGSKTGYQLTPNIFASGFLNATIDKIYQAPIAGAIFQEGATNIVAQPLILWYSTSNLTTGNSPLRINITYRIITTSF